MGERKNVRRMIRLIIIYLSLDSWWIHVEITILFFRAHHMRHKYSTIFKCRKNFSYGLNMPFMHEKVKGRRKKV